MSGFGNTFKIYFSWANWLEKLKRVFEINFSWLYWILLGLLNLSGIPTLTIINKWIAIFSKYFIFKICFSLIMFVWFCRNREFATQKFVVWLIYRIILSFLKSSVIYLHRKIIVSGFFFRKKFFPVDILLGYINCCWHAGEPNNNKNKINKLEVSAKISKSH